MFQFLTSLFNRQNIREASDIKDLHDHLIGMDHLHRALFAHLFLHEKQHAQTCEGDVPYLLRCEGEVPVSHIDS